jgi:hypothetical protein
MDFKQSYLQKLSWSCSVIDTLFRDFAALFGELPVLAVSISGITGN